MNNPKVTIAIPVYNVAKYVEKSILSALNQDFVQPYEVLVVDDCGTDNSMHIIERIIKEHPKGNLIRIIKHEQNKGLGPARNTSIENAKGDYLFFLDSDDWISVNCLSLLYTKAIETNSDVTVGSIVRLEEDTSKVLGRNIYPNKTIEKPAAGVYMVNHAPDMHIEVWNKLFKLNFLKTNHIGCVHRIFEDYNFDFIMRASACKITLCSDITLYYNIRANSILTNLKSKGSDEAMKTLCDIIKVLQSLLINRFGEVEGIYDLYFQRLIWIYENFGRYSFTEVQLSYIDEQLATLWNFVPSEDCLKNPRNTFIYTKMGDSSLCSFQDVQRLAGNRRNKLILNVKKFLNNLS